MSADGGAGGVPAPGAPVRERAERAEGAEASPQRPRGDASPVDRRSFLAALPALAAAGGALPATLAACGATTSPDAAADGFGVQLYTLRGLLADDLEGTLAAVAEMGYAHVETHALFGLTPAQLRSRLDAVGLAAASGHVGLGDVRDRLDELLDAAGTLGQELLVVPSIPGDERTPEALRAIADELSAAGQAARAAGVRLGYHNHDWELAPFADGTRPIDLLLDRTDPDLVDWQMDVYWTVHGGGDPFAYLTERSGRVTSVHVKDRAADGRMVAVGSGVIDFGAVLPLAAEHGLLYSFVEHDNPDDPLDSVRRSLRHLTSLGSA